MAVEVVEVVNTKTGGRASLPVSALALPTFGDWRPVDAEGRAAVSAAKKES